MGGERVADGKQVYIFIADGSGLRHANFVD
jgi:hypothetical protein